MAQTISAPKVALVLGGGSARGASHIGVIRALNEAGIPIDMIVSTSMGSVVGGLYAAGFSTETLNRLIVEVSPVYTAELQFPPTGGLLDGRPFEEMMTSLSQNMRLQDTVIPFIPVVTDLGSNEPVALTTGQFASAVHASMAIPILFIPVQIDGHFYYDGGLKAAVPVEFARAQGAEVVIAVDVTRDIEADPGNILTNFQTIYLDLIAGFNEAQLGQANILLDPGLQYDSYMSFDQVRRFEQAGYEATQSRMHELLTFLKEAGVPLRSAGDINAKNPLNQNWSERLKEARRHAAERSKPLTVNLDLGLEPSPYQSGYQRPVAPPLSIARFGFDVSEGALGDFGLGASLGISTLSDAISVSLRASYQPAYAWRLSTEVFKDLEQDWELEFGVRYRYSDFEDLHATTQVLLQPLSGRLEVATQLEQTGLSTYLEMMMPLSARYYRTAVDFRTALRWHEIFLHGRGFIGFASNDTPPSEQFGFGQPVLMRGTPLSEASTVLVANLELGWQAELGTPLADAVLLKPFAWGFLDLGYASSSNAALGLGAGVEGLLFGFAPFTMAADLGYGLNAGTWTLALRSEIWPAAYEMLE